MGAFLRGLRHWLLALQFSTRVPVTGRLAAWVGYSPAMLRASAAHLPGIGWVVGGVSAVVLAGTLWAMPAVPASPWVAAVLATVAGLVLTGAFHEDGLADLADGLGGSSQRERALEIMKDSRLGSFGAIALFMALLLKCALLATLAQWDPSLAVWALFAGHVVSRLFPLWLMHALPYVAALAGSKSQDMALPLGWGALGVGLLWSVASLALAMAVIPSSSWLMAVLVPVLTCACMQRLLQRRLQGYTGDALGATQQLCELAYLLGLAMGLGRGG